MKRFIYCEACNQAKETDNARKVVITWCFRCKKFEVHSQLLTSAGRL